MHASCNFLNYSDTNFFSKIVNDYTSNHQNLKQFIEDFPSVESFAKKIETRKSFHCNRELLVQVLKEQYQSINLSDIQLSHIEALNNENCFTVTTAHQPNIFTGPLYFIYKIVHAIQLANELQTAFPNNHFVPIYYMGSEDADLDELGSFTIDGYTRKWQTTQTGAVGRMVVDATFLQLINDVANQINVKPYGAELTTIFQTCYVKGASIQQATLQLVQQLFASYGLIVIVPDNALLKSTFKAIVTKELLTQFSHKAVEETNLDLQTNYTAQAAGRSINLFYLINDKRERIEKENDFFVVKKLNLSFSEQEILQLLHTNPERFSANVILRPIFQETVLPNIAFIGGGGELAYWMQLKTVFNQANTSYPILILRNSFLLIDGNEKKKLDNLGFSIKQFFEEEAALIKKLVTKQSLNNWHVAAEMKSIEDIFEQLTTKAKSIDTTLINHVQSILVKTQDKVKGIEAKMYRAEKRKFEVQQQQIKNLKQTLFPNDSLQERVENFSSYYTKFGKNFIDILLKNSKGFEQKFTILSLEL